MRVTDSENLDKVEREKRIDKERKRLIALFKNIDVKKKSVVLGLIDRAAFMRVSLADLEEDINENGFVEWFSQGSQDPYQRKRPAADQYNTMSTAYAKVVKQLSDLLPKDAGGITDDGFEAFVNGRAEV